MKHLQNLASENIWITKKIYDDAERVYQENLAKASLAPLAWELAEARQHLIESRNDFKNIESSVSVPSQDPGFIKFLEKKFEASFNQILAQLQNLERRIDNIGKTCVESHKTTQTSNVHEINVSQTNDKKATKDDDDDDVDLFGSDSDDDEAANKIREERLAAYHEKKSKKPVLIAKSNVILDIKPWYDETDMAAMEAEVRKITADGLVWRAAKLVPLAYGIHKLQISSVVEDDKVSIDWLTEKIEELQDYVQSVDIAASNKI